MQRRTFVKAGACALVALAGPPRFLVRAAAGAERQGKVLVAVFQRGAVDGLSMVIPHGDPGYTGVRPSIGLKTPKRGESDRALDLDGFFAVHPALAPLLPLWQSRALAVVHACGSPDTTRSHFDAQDYMEAGTPGVKSTPDGWLARAVQARPKKPSPFRAVALGPQLPRVLQGEAGAISLTTLDRFDVRAADDAGATRRGFESLYAEGVRDLLHGTGRETFEAVKMLRSAGAARVPPANGAEYPRSPFGESLRQIAQLVRAGVGLEVAFADMQGWDTHVGQGAEQGQLATKLREFGAALAAFARDLGDRMADVVLLTMSEFGRTVAENGSRGTDHGHATAMLVLGGGVRGGKVYGRWPGLSRQQLFEGRDLAVTTDFRTLFAEVAGTHLGVTAAPLFPGFTPPAPLGLFA
ncbi:MAG: DUF1501 domain-containing protein [Candidatus Rokubacteria bacterium]|nr:DUF1501 domain-containing protein [Candidatus Rokubacteria bacterium]MBI4254493.1 DUF1501 domain-containing protein [Candidatus Rokubacteria bacterium]